MRQLRLLLLSLLILPSLALATPRDDLFTDIHAVSEPLAVQLANNTFQTQSLRLLDDIAAGIGGGGGGGTTDLIGINGVAPAVGNGITSTGTLRVTLSSDSTGQVKLAAGVAAIGSVTVSNFPATQPISAAALPLPTGASTETTLAALNTKVTAVNTGAVTVASSALPTGASTSAKQPALGTAGTPSADVLTVQGATSMTALKTDGSGVTQPVSGTVTANAGTNLNTSALALDATLTGGTQKTKLVDTGGTNVGSISAAGALKVDNSGVTQPVSGTVTTTPPSNASTNIAQINAVTPLMGNGVTGTGSQRVTISSDNTAFSVNANAGTNLNTSALALDATAAKLNTAQGAAIASVTGPLGQTSTTTAAPTYVTATVNPLSTDTAGNLRVVDRSVVAPATAIGSTQGALVQGSVTTANPTYTTGQINPISLATNGGIRIDLNSIIGNLLQSNVGAAGVGVPRVVLASDSPSMINEDGASANANSLTAIGVIRRDTPVANANVSADGDYTNPATDNFGRLWTANVETPVIDQGVTPFRLISAATTNATVIKASQGNVYGIEVFNNGAAARYLKFYNASSSPTVGTTTTVKVLMIPAGGGVMMSYPAGIQFSTGISIATTANLVDTDTTAVAINEMAININYK